MDATAFNQAHANGHSIVERLDFHARQTPDAIALESNSGALTFRDLDDRANALAQQLRALGIGPESIVGLRLPRSLAMVVAMLGVLKSGGAYLPLDASDPHTRTDFMLVDAGATVVVMADCNQDSAPHNGRRSVIVVDELGRLVTPVSPSPLPSKPKRPINPRTLAYVIYTSGSTGTPKGVEVSHENLMHLVSWHLSAFQMTNRDHASHVARVAFDAAGWEIWSCLAAGACLHIPEDNQVSDPKALQAWLIEKCITISFVPTPIAERLLKLSWPPKTDLRFLLTGGDTLHAHPSPKLPFALINNYGPTECTVVATSGIIHADDSDHSLPSIGRPISGTQIHILDENLRPVPEGVPGEIYIAGTGVARGYRNQPALTEERFIPHPLAGRSGRMFKTGDLAHFMADGQIAFLGRTDDQIKIRGFRIEPNEIVAVLNQHPAIAESAVVARDIAGERRLVAHVVLATDARVGPSDLREFIGKQLPDYMVPARFVKLESMPLTSNGKVDRAALPAPDAMNDLCDDDSRGTTTEIEEIVAGILQPLLGIEHVNLDANFFSLGGHSLLGIQLISRVREVLGIELPLRTIFDAPSVTELAAEIEQLLCAKLDALSEEKVQCILGVAENPQT